MLLKKILVIEDSELLQKGYNLLFHRYRAKGCEIIRAHNGKQGLEQLCTHPNVDLIILDINMPVMSGLEFLYHRERHPVLTNIPVIISSTEGEEHDIVRGLEAGADAYVVKPFDADELHELITKVTNAVSSKLVQG